MRARKSKLEAVAHEYRTVTLPDGRLFHLRGAERAAEFAARHGGTVRAFEIAALPANLRRVIGC